MSFPIRLRLTLWYSALLAGALLLFSGSVYVLMNKSLVDNLDAGIRQHMSQITRRDVDRTPNRLAREGRDTDGIEAPVAAILPSGRLLGQLPPAPIRSWLSVHPQVLAPGTHAATVHGLRVVIESVSRRGRVVAYLLGWQSMRGVDDAERSLLLLMLAAGPGLLIVAGIGGMVLARRALRPVSEMTHIASVISASDLHRRVPVNSVHDELSELALTFNAMIDRLEAAVDRERRFTSDASHELRAPISVIMAEASLALERPGEAGEMRAALEVIADQAQGMEELVAALLTLARVEVVKPQWDLVLLQAVIERAAAQCLPLAQSRGVHIDGQPAGHVYVEANPALLARALRNIFDNAVRVTPSGGSVRYEVSVRGGMATVKITDQGPGIPAQHREKIFEPFYQINEARTSADSHGLGLAICRRIVTAHGCDISVTSVPGEGACFAICLPVQRLDASPANRPDLEGTRQLAAPGGPGHE